MLALLALCALASAPQDPEAARPSFGVELSEGPAARAFAGTAPDQVAAKLDLQGQPLARRDPLWSDPALWQRWAGWVRGEADGPPDAARASRLALFALLGERTDDAWDHFARAARSKAHAAALLPLFLPGVDAKLVARGIASPGGVAQGLPDGVALAPALPPAGVPSSDVVLGLQRIDRRSMRVAGVEVGAAKLAFTVTLESDGVEVDVEHLSGGPAQFTLILPEPPDFEIYVEYLDWMREEAPRAPITVDVHPGAEPRVLFGRYRRRTMPWPTLVPERLPRGIALSGLEVRAGATAPPELAAFVAGLRGLFDFPCTLRAGGAADARASGSPVVVDLAPPEESLRKLAGILSLAEHWVLERKTGDRR